MSTARIGVNVNDLSFSPKEGLQRASKMGFRTVELPAVTGEIAPSSLSASGRRHVARYVDGLGLRVAALVGDLTGTHLTDPRTVDEHVELTCQVVELAADLDVPLVSASASALTHPETKEPSPSALGALRRIGEFADGHGIFYCLRPSCDDGDRMGRVLGELSCPSLRLGLDPAAMVMSSVNPLSLIEHAADQIALVYARDATVGLGSSMPLSGRTGCETRLGDGEVDLVGLFAALGGADYTGPYIIRRTNSQNPVADIRSARDLLNRLLPPG